MIFISFCARFVHANGINSLNFGTQITFPLALSSHAKARRELLIVLAALHCDPHTC